MGDEDRDGASRPDTSRSMNRKEGAAHHKRTIRTPVYLYMALALCQDEGVREGALASAIPSLHKKLGGRVPWEADATLYSRRSRWDFCHWNIPQSRGGPQKYRMPVLAGSDDSQSEAARVSAIMHEYVARNFQDAEGLVVVVQKFFVGKRKGRSIQYTDCRQFVHLR